MTCRITGITLDGNDAAGIKPANISRGCPLHHDFRARQAHGACTLTGIGNMEMQRLAFRMPQGPANIMLAGSRYFKFRFALPYGFFNSQQQVLGGHTVMSLHGINLEHYAIPLLTYILNAELVGHGLVRGYQRIAAADRQ